VLDEASFEREAAERYRRISQSDEREKDVETAMTNYIRMVASERAVRPRSDDEYPEGLWAVRADGLPNGWLLQPPTEANAECRGTFRRRIAQERPDLHFFNVGHPLFDALMQSLTGQTAGRTYAIDIKSATRMPWMGFEFVFYPAPQVTALGDNLGLLNQVRQLFESVPIHLFCRYHDLELEPDGASLRSFRQTLEKKDKDKSWWNLTKLKAVHLQEHLLAQDWEQKVQKAFELSRAEAKKRFAEQLETDLATEAKRLLEFERQAKREGNANELQSLAALKQAIENWSVELDSVGFLSINGNILGKH
jgi:hypothetical protein